MKKIHLFIICAIISLLIIGCLLPYDIRIKNNSGEDIIIKIDTLLPPQSHGFIDTVAYAIPAGDSIKIESKAFCWGNDGYERELRKIIILNNSGNTLETVWISGTFIQSQRGLLEFPVRQNAATVWFTTGVKYIYGYSLYSWAQIHYNYGEYDSCLSSIISALEELAIATNASSDMLNATLRGCYLLGFLAASKSGKSDYARLYWSELNGLSPQYAEFLRDHDPEIHIFYRQIYSE